MTEPPTPFDLSDLPEALRERREPEVRAYVQTLEAQVLSLQQQVEALSARLNQHSQNSSRPPSADPPSAPPRRARRKSKRKRGGRPGHQGHHRARLEACQVDEIIEHWPVACPDCQLDLPAGAPAAHRSASRCGSCPPCRRTTASIATIRSGARAASTQ